MRRLASLILAFLPMLPDAASAETVQIRSGDHDGFTRLLIQFEGREDWVFGRVEGGFEFRPRRRDIAYGLDDVYQRIGRDRITDVRDLGDGRLFLAVDCACHGSVDELADGQVVLDVIRGDARDPGAGIDARLPAFEATVEASSDVPAMEHGSTMPAAPPRLPLAPNVPAVVAPVIPQIRLPITFPGKTAAPDGATSMTDHAAEASPVGPGRDTETPPPSVAPQTPPALDPDAQARVSETQKALLEQIARAAAQGLLDVDTSDVERSIAAAQPPVVDRPSPPPETVPELPPATPRGHVAIETSVDRAASRGKQEPDETDDGEVCIDPVYFDVPSWGTLDDYGADIGAYRSRIVGEFDIADGEGITALGRNYIFITFGAEAQALIRRYPNDIERPDLLFAMAEIMDEGESAAAPGLVDQMACAGATALWATLAQPELQTSQSINRQAVTLAFGALPPHLRRHLGPGLADKFLAIDDNATVGILRGAIERAAGEPTSATSLLAAQFDLADGNVAQATAKLDEVVENADATLPDALLERVETALTQGEAVAADLISLLDGLAFQHRGTELGPRLMDAAIRARASGGAFAEALAKLDEATGNGVIPPEREGVLLQDIFARLGRDTDDVGFLRLTIERLDTAAALPSETRQAVAVRLLELGFSGPARQVLDGNGTVPQAEVRRLFARAALMDRRPDVAIGYLTGLEDPVAMRLRAEAMDLAKDHVAAVRIFDEIGDREAGLRSAWRGGLWPEVAEHDSGAEGMAARLMIGGPAMAPEAEVPGVVAEGAPNPDPGVPMPPPGMPEEQAGTPPRSSSLAAGQALIDHSRSTREALQALLDRLGHPADDPTSPAAPAS